MFMLGGRRWQRSWLRAAAWVIALVCFVLPIGGPAGAQGQNVGGLIDRANTLLVAGKAADAVPVAELAVREATVRLGEMHPATAQAHEMLARALGRVGRFEEAETAGRRSLGIYELAGGRMALNAPAVLNTLGGIYKEQGRLREAADHYERSASAYERLYGQQHLALAAPLTNLADTYRALGRFEEAERLFQRSLTIREKAQGRDHHEVAGILNNLGVLYYSLGRFKDAEPLLVRSLSIKERRLGKQHPSVANTLNSLGLLYVEQRRFGDAETLLLRALDINTVAYGPSHPAVAVGVINFAKLLGDQGRREQAEQLYRNVLQKFAGALDGNDPVVSNLLNNMAALAHAAGRLEEAERLVDRSRALLEAATGPSSPAVAASLRNLALTQMAQRRWQAAYDTLERATGILRGRAAGPERAAEIADERRTYVNLATAAWGLAAEQPARRAALTNAAFEASQLAERSSAGTALAQMTARFGAGNSELAGLIRQRQDTLSQWQNASASLTRALASPSGQRNDAEVARLRRDADALESTALLLTGRVVQAFPSFAELSRPRPLALGEAQRLLGRDEVLVAYVIEGSDSFVWAVTREESRWQRLMAGSKDIATKIAGLRVGLDLEDLKAAVVSGKLFDLTLAHELYTILLEPVADLLKGKSSLIVVPTGPLTSLPFQVLVSAKPAATATEDRLAPYRAARWLIRSHAVTVLPAVSSLRALRGLPKSMPAPKPLIGFGDPMFGSTPPIIANAKSGASTRRSAPQAFASYWRGNAPDVAALRAGLAPLPETASELRAVARSVGAGEADLRVGSAATETAVKSADLTAYRIVYFATHGLVAGDAGGLAEPALALTVPPKPSEADDGLLTASEVAQLKLNADWVVMSACNTAAGGAPGAEALSGLARAFFYAGARALLVSHWKVESGMAVLLTTTAFEALRKEPGIGRAEALRRAMLATIDHGGDAWTMYPDFWAPFSVVGEGGRTAP
jgi:CHAT domain-containing protein/tetratricopeptide (TPR) repeat protein